jgi:hypothetical protein
MKPVMPWSAWRSVGGLRHWVHGILPFTLGPAKGCTTRNASSAWAGEPLTSISAWLAGQLAVGLLKRVDRERTGPLAVAHHLAPCEYARYRSQEVDNLVGTRVSEIKWIDVMIDKMCERVGNSRTFLRCSRALNRRSAGSG